MNQNRFQIINQHSINSTVFLFLLANSVMKGHIYKLFFYVASLQMRMQQFRVVWYLVTLLQTLLYLIMIIQPYVPADIKSTIEAIFVFFYMKQDSVQRQYHTYFFLVSASIVLGLGIGCFFIHILMTPRYHSLEKVPGKLKTPQIITVIIIFCMQTTAISGIAAITYNFEKISQLPFYMIIFQILLFFVLPLQILFCRSYKLMSFMEPLIIFLFYISAKNPLVLSVSIALGGIIHIINQTNQFYKFLLKSLIITSIWAIIQNFQTNKENIAISYIFLGIGIIISLLTSFLQPIDEFVIKSSEFNGKFQNQLLFEMYQKLKKKGTKELSLSQQFKLQTIFMKQNQSFKQRSQNNLKDSIEFTHKYQQPLSEWAKQDYMQKVNEKFDNQELISSSQNDLKAIIMGYKVKIIMKKNLLETLRSLVSSDLMSSPQKRNYYEQYIIYKFGILDIDRYLNEQSTKNNKKQSDTIRLIDIECETKKYYDYILQLIQRLKFFWDLLSKDVVNVQDLNEQLLEIQKLIQKCSEKLDYLGQNYTAKSQKILFAKVMVFINSEKANLFAKEHLYDEPSHKHSLSNIKLANLGYIKLDSKGIVNKISFKLSVDMGYTEDQLFQSHISKIFPSLIDKVFFKELQIVHPGKTNNLRIPVCLSSSPQLFAMRKLSIMMYIDFSKGIQYLIHLNQRQTPETQALILVDYNTGAIPAVSNKFIQTFGLSIKKVRKLIKEQSFFWNQTFPECKLSSPETRKIRTQNGLNTKIRILQISKSKQKQQTAKVNLRVQKQYIFQDKKILLIIISNKHNSKSVKSQETIQNENSFMVAHSTRKIFDEEIQKIDIGMESNAKMNANLYKNQKFFCPIPNSYFLKIRDKRQSMLNQNSGKVGLLMIVKIAFFLFGFLFIGETIGFYMIQHEKTEQFGLHYQNFERINNQQILLFNSYAQVYTINYFLKNKDTIIENLASLADPYLFRISQSTFNKTLQYHRKKLNKKTLEFQNQFLLSSKIWNSSYVIKTNYSLNFSSYKIDTDTSQANYYDFVENFQIATLQSSNVQKKQVIQNALKFLLRNYQELRNTNQTFQSASLYIAAMNQPFLTNYALFIAIGLVFLVLVIVVQCLLFKVQAVVTSIISICKFVGRQDCQRQIGAIQTLKDNTIQFTQFSNRKAFKKNEKQKNTKLKSQIIEFSKQQKCSSPIVQQFTENVNNNQMQSPEDINLVNSKQKQQQSEFSSWHFQDKKIFPKKDSQPKSLIGLQYNNSKLIGILFVFLFLLVLVSGMLFWQNYLSQSQRNEMIDVIKYEQQLLKGRSTTLRYLIDALQIRFVQQIYSHEIPLPFIPTSYYKSFSAVDYLPTDFDQFIRFYFKDPQTKPCQIHYSSLQDPINKMKNCNEIMSGLLNINYAQALQMYENIFIKLKGRNMNQYFQSIQGFDPVYPNFLAGLFAKQILQNFIENAVEKFMKATQSHVKSVQSYIIVPMAMWISLGIIYLIVGYIIISNKLQVKTKLGIGYFNILPESVMGKISLTSYIRSEEVLEKLDRL